MFYLCDNPALLKAVKKSIGESDVSRSARHRHFMAIKELQERTIAGTATFLVKVKVHRGEPANEEADVQADKAISSQDVPTEWRDRTKSSQGKSLAGKKVR